VIDTPRTSRLRRLSSILLVALLAGGSATLIVGSAVEAAENAAFQTITSENLVQMLQQKDFVLVNVHIPYEGEIAETDTFIPFDRIAENLNKLPADKAAKIVLYCRSGRMSEIAATTLAGLGYTHVDHLAGGMIGWETSGHRLLHE
jgi:rhodanese-related sulfurtransferase